MPSSAILGRYALYKEGTARLVRWLTTNAARCSAAYANAHLKGTVSASDLLRFARAIAATNTSIDIPANVVELLADIIYGRRFCADWYTSQTLSGAVEGATESSNKSHEHFVEVLQEVHDVLKAARKSRNASTPSVPRTSEPNEVEVKDPLSNLFDQLELEQPSGSPLGDELQNQASSSDSGQPPIHNMLAIDERTEKESVLWCFLKDLYEMRTYIRSIWDEYAEGKLSSMAASTVTDTAFGMMRRANDQLITAYPDFSDLTSVLSFLSLTVELGEDEVPRLVATGSEAPTNADSDVSALLSPMAAHVFSQVQRLWADWEKEANEPQEEVQTSASPERSKIAGDETETHASETSESKWRDAMSSEAIVQKSSAKMFHYHGFAVAIGALIPDMECLIHCWSPKSAQYNDEFVNGFVQMRQIKECRLWFVVACQTYMDIFDVVGARPWLGVEELCTAYRSSETTKTDYLRFRKTFEHSTTSPRVLDILDDQVLFGVGMVESLVYHRTGIQPRFPEGKNRSQAQQRAGWVSRSIFRTLVLTPGWYAYQHAMSMHVVGIYMSNDNHVAVATAHLYKAAQHYGLLRTAWTDMDLFVELQSKKRPLVPDIGPGADDMAVCRHWELAMGIPASYVTSQRLRSVCPPLHTVLQNEKRIASGSRFLNDMGNRGRCDQKMGFTRGEPLDVVLTSIHEEKEDAKRSAGNRASVRAAKRSPTQVTALELLKIFKDEITADEITADEPELHFNYIGFWTRCAELLQDMARVLKRELPKSARDQLERPVHLVSALLYEAVRYQRASRPLEQSAFGHAARMLQDFIDEHGDIFASVALEQSSGHIPAHLRPDLTAVDGDSMASMSQSAAEPEDELEGQEESTGTVEAAEGPDIRSVFAARKKRGRRLLRTRK